MCAEATFATSANLVSFASKIGSARSHHHLGTVGRPVLSYVAILRSYALQGEHSVHLCLTMHSVHYTFLGVGTYLEDIRKAFKNSGWSVSQLLEATKLKCDRSSLHRKLHGKQRLTMSELLALAKPFDIKIDLSRKSLANALGLDLNR